MIALKVNDVKAFMNCLFLQEAFDDFFLVNLDLDMEVSYKIDGKRKKEWFTEEENSEYVPWRFMKNRIFSLIKGGRTPLSIKIVFLAGDDVIKEILSKDKKIENQDFSLFLNLKFEKGELTIITGASTADFLLNKELNSLWDGEVQSFLKKIEIAFE